VLNSEKKTEKRFSMNFLDTLGAGDPLSWENTMRNSGGSADRDRFYKAPFRPKTFAENFHPQI
jgi:hypothetical protein